MNINQAFPSKYLKADDCEEDLLVTIKTVKMEQVGQGQKQEMKAILFFNELPKGLVLNKTNAKMIEKITGSADTDEWTGAKIRLISTEVEFQGDLVMAVRVREPKKPLKRVTEAPAEAPESDDDNTPF